MNQHPANSVFRAIKSATEPEFTRKLTWNEQRKLSDAAFNRYIDWLFALNSPATKRWERRERGEDNLNRDTTIDTKGEYHEGWDWGEQRKQSST